MKKSISLLFIIVFVSFAFVGCDRDNHSFCDVSDPLKLTWLKDTIADLDNSPQDIVIHMGNYKGQKAFEFMICCLTCSRLNYAPELYNCLGKKIENPDLNEFTYEKTVYRKPGTECQ